MPVERPLNPMADVFVRYLLGSESNKDLLIDFVNPVFAHKGHDLVLVVELEIRNPFNLRELQENKESILDVKAKDGTGRRINVEIQIAHEPAYGARSLYYSTSNPSSNWMTSFTLGVIISRRKGPSRRTKCRYC